MGKVIGILLVVLAVWGATEFAAGRSPFSGSQSDGEERSLSSVPARAGAKVSDAFEQGNKRREAMLPE